MNTAEKLRNLPLDKITFVFIVLSIIQGIIQFFIMQDVGASFVWAKTLTILSFFSIFVSGIFSNEVTKRRRKDKKEKGDGTNYLVYLALLPFFIIVAALIYSYLLFDTVSWMPGGAFFEITITTLINLGFFWLGRQIDAGLSVWGPFALA